MVGSNKPGCKENPFEPCPSGMVLLLTWTSPFVIYIILSLVSSCQLSYRILPNFLWFSNYSLAFAFRGTNVQWFWEVWRHFLGEEKVLWLVSFLCTMPSNNSGIFSIWYAICALHILAFSCYVQYFCTVFFVKFCLMAINEWSWQTHCHYPWFAHDNMVVKNECIFLCWEP